MRIESLIDLFPAKYTLADRNLVMRAYQVAENAHRLQKRASGEPYITHCIAVAGILAEMRLPASVVAAALLHDTVEDTDIKLEDIERDFGIEIAIMVDGVTKLTHLPRVSRGDQHHDEDQKEEELRLIAERRNEVLPDEAIELAKRSRRYDLVSETLRKTFLAMGDDVRIVMIKLADRLHNIRTLGHMPEAKRKRIAQETLDIFAPLANRLGIWQIKWELEDLAFRYVNPEKYREIADAVASQRSARERETEAIKIRMEKVLAQAGINADVSARPKHIYSIYRKMNRKGVPFDMIHDLRGVRVIIASDGDDNVSETENEAEGILEEKEKLRREKARRDKEAMRCYATLGVIHATWRPIPGEFDDYIAGPKDNFYRSLHTTVLYDDGKYLEVQIRTVEMHQEAEYGIAAHWRYKEGESRNEEYEKLVAWLRSAMDWRHDVDDAREFVDGMKSDVFQDRVYVFTPKGDIIDLPSGATPIDFAYQVHTDVGHRCRGAKISGKLVALDYTLRTGDKVEIMIAKRGGPSRDWLNPNLNLVKTQRALSKIRQWFRRQAREQNSEQGKVILEKELRHLGLIEVNLDRLAREFEYRLVDDLYVAIGTGDLPIAKIVKHLTLGEGKDEQGEQNILIGRTPIAAPESTVTVLGLKGLLTTMARCCHPVPGEEIIGYITRGRGATIHRSDCPNVFRITDRERLVLVTWGEQKVTYPIPVRIKAFDRGSLMKDVSTLISNEGVNMTKVKVETSQSMAVFDLVLEVHDILELSRILDRLEQLPNVFEARRVRPG